ncbi:MAG: hypothetical protein LAT63_02925 [Marinobacter sp.]|nr:hypothetical protein [Marinobacter sp.]
MTSIEFMAYLFFGIMGVAIMLMAILFPLWTALHLTLLPKLDAILFRQPFFQERELWNYQIFPLSLLRSLNYIYLVAFPRLAKKKRFKGFDESLPISWPTIAACKLHAVLCALILLMGIPYIGISVWVFMFL